MSERCPTCGGQDDYPMLIHQLPRVICAGSFHEKWFHKVLSHRKPEGLWQRLKAAYEAFLE